MRLVHQTFVVLAIVVLVAVGSMAALFALTLESGFVAYVNARQQEQFETFHRLLAAQVAQEGTLVPVFRNEFLWRRLMRQAEGEADIGPPPDEPPLLRPRMDGDRVPMEGGPDDREPGDRGPEGRPPGDGPPDERPMDASGARATAGPYENRRPRLGDFDGRPPKGFRRGGPPGARKGPPDNNPYGLGHNVILLDAERRPVYRSPRVFTRDVTPLERELSAAGRTVGFVQWWPIDKVERPEDLAYLRSQYRNLAWGTGALVMLMLAVAPLIASRVTRPLRRVTAATERIAHGDLDVRLDEGGSDEIGMLMSNVNAMVGSLQRLEQARRRWIAEIAHELRTPLTVLQAELEALALGVRPLGPKAIASLQEETRHLTRLVGDLHQLALADLDALPCTMGPVDLAQLARRVTERFAPEATAKGLRLEVDVPQPRIDIEADAQRLEQLLSNLLQNSLRYTDAPGRIVVRATRREGSIGTQVSPGADGGSANVRGAVAPQAELVVEDSPPGVAREDYERLFDPLYRADEARSRKSGGSGLGLAIARAIVVAHGGTIVASSSPLGGLRLVATLPGDGKPES